MTALGTDSFNRANHSGGFGTGTDSQVWNVAQGGPANFSVVSNQGQISGSTTSQGAYYGSATSSDQEVLVRFSISATGDTAQIYLRGINNGTQYRVRCSDTTIFVNRLVTNVSTLLTSIANTVTVNTMYWMRARVIGGPSTATLFVKVWQDGLSTGEPSTWNINAFADGSPITGAGQYGLGASLTTATDKVLFDSFYAADYVNLIATPASDSLLATEAFLPVDALSANDVLLATETYSATDALSASDSYQAGGVFVPVDALSATDILLNTNTYMPLDALIVSDSLLNTDTALFLDALSITDLFSGVATVPTIVLFLNVLAPFRDNIVQVTFRG